jgi:hypothetical protein
VSFSPDERAIGREGSLDACGRSQETYITLEKLIIIYNICINSITCFMRKPAHVLLLNLPPFPPLLNH